jgi:hypothetical protein
MSKPKGSTYRVERSNTTIAGVVLHRSRLRPDQNMASDKKHRR